MKKNNLERAKELKERDIIYINKKISEFPYSDSMNKIFKESKELLKETKKGCEFWIRYKDGVAAFRCGDLNKHYCKNCQEAIKICEEILQ